MNILGISAYYHDSAAALIQDGIILSAAQEERFTRKKHDASFPERAIESCLEIAGLTFADIDYICFYDKPFVKFERLIETYLAYAPRGFRSFVKSMPIWLKEKLYTKSILKKELAQLGGVKESKLPPLLFNDHHQSHAASAFYPSPYEKAAVLCLDGVGEWATSSVWMGEKNSLQPLWEIDFPHSLGLLYSAFTYYSGFKVNSGEYKLMGLAPYGEPRYTDLILDKLVRVKDDGTFRLNMSYFNFATGLTMTNGKFHQLFGGLPREPESELTKKDMDIARSIQQVTEEIVLKLANTIYKETGADYLCMAGGVALNCVANGRILREGHFKNIWVQPAAGDAGGALGAALSVWYEYLKNERVSNNETDHMRGSYLGRHYKNDEIKSYLDSIKAPYTMLPDDKLMPQLSELIKANYVLGWFNGPMEFGPRALGGRSILGNPKNESMQSVMNLKIKHRESFRPFAPAVQAEKANEWFEIDRSSPYMLFVAPVVKSKRIESSTSKASLAITDRIKEKRSKIPAVTHVDYSARVQTVHKQTNPRFHDLIEHCGDNFGCPMVINTSFNVRGEPIVASPEDAYRCFMRTEMDYLVMENCLLDKKLQSSWQEKDHWEKELPLD